MTDPVIFGLDALDTITNAEAGVWCAILLPNGNQAMSPSGTPIRVKVRGTDSAPYQKAVAERGRIALAAAQKRARGAAVDPTDDIKGAVEVISACLCAWEGFETPASTKDNIETIAPTDTNVRAALTRYSLVRDQIDRFISERANFLLVPLNS